MLIEVAGWRLLTDPTFDPPGRRYSFGWGTASRKLTGPAIAAAALPSIDAVLLSHDHHGDNLDTRAVRSCPPTGQVVTTVLGARRLGGGPAGSSRGRQRGSRPGQAIDRGHRHAVPPRPAAEPPARRPRYRLRAALDGQEHGVLWISGDTVLYDGVRQVADRIAVDTAMLHLGGVRFPVTGPLRYSMTARKAVELCRLIRPRTVIPSTTRAGSTSRRAGRPSRANSRGAWRDHQGSLAPSRGGH